MTELAAKTDLVHRQWSWFVDTLTAAGQEVWDRPTRLAGWNVEDLARHVHWGVTLEEDGLALAREGGDGTAAGSQLQVPREQIVPALRIAVAGLVERLEELSEPLSGGVRMPYGELPMGLAVSVFVMEAALHSSDLADAVADFPTGTAAADRLPEGSHAPTAAVLQAVWPMLAAGAAARPADGTTIRLAGTTVRVEAGYDGDAWGPPLGEPAVVIEGSDDAVLLYAYGRLPFDQAGLTVRGDRDLAVRLKELLPGP